jgi:MFS family permease
MSLGMMSVTIAMYFFAYDFATLFIIILADAFVGTLYMPAANAMIADVIPSEKRPSAFSTIRIAWNTGLFVGPAIAMLIVSTLSIRELFLFGSTTLAAAFVMNMFLIPETKPKGIVPEEITFRKTMAVGRNKPFLVLCVLTGTLWFFLSQWMSVLSVYMTDDLGFDLETVGLLFSINGLMVVSLQLWITSRTVKLRRSIVLMAGQTIAAVGFSMLFLVSDLQGVLGCIVIMTIGELIYMSIISAIIADMSPEVERGLYMGFAGFIQNIAMGAGMLFGMVLLDALPQDRVIWLIFGAFGVLTSLGYPLFARMIGPEKDHPAKYGHAPSASELAAGK